MVEAARPVSFDPERSVVEVGFPPSAAFNKRKVEMKANRELFLQALQSVAGVPLRPAFVLLDEEEASSEPGNGERVLSDEEEQALVARLVSEFDAEEFVPDAEPSERSGEAATSDGEEHQ